METEGQLIRAALGGAWHQLSPKTQARFSADPIAGTSQEYMGTMAEVKSSAFGKLLALCGRPFRAPLIPYNEQNVPIEVEVYKEKGQSEIIKRRIYRFQNHPHLTVQSSMRVDQQGEFIECVGKGLAVNMEIFVDNGTLCFSGERYIFSLLGGSILIPLFLTPGRIFVRHSDHGEDAFRVKIEMTHPWFGLTFLQDGIFTEKPQ